MPFGASGFFCPVEAGEDALLIAVGNADAGVADGEHLHQGHYDGDDGGGEGPEEEAADGDGGGLHIQLEEAVHLGQHLAQEHGDIGHGCEHAQGGDGLDAHAGAGGGDDGDIGIGHKNTLLRFV